MSWKYVERKCFSKNGASGKILGRCECAIIYFVFRNVLISKNVNHANHVALTDFGLSRKVDDDEPLKVFSHRWASPELFRNKKFTFETDIWAFGKLIF